MDLDLLLKLAVVVGAFVGAAVGVLLLVLRTPLRKMREAIEQVGQQVQPDGGDTIREHMDVIRRELRDHLDALSAQLTSFRRANMDLIEHPMFESQADGHCLFVNLTYCDRMGITRDAALGNGWISCVHPDDREIVRETWDDCVRDHRVFEAQYRMVHRLTQAPFKVRCRAIPVAGSEKVIAYVGMLRADA